MAKSIFWDVLSFSLFNCFKIEQHWCQQSQSVNKLPYLSSSKVCIVHMVINHYSSLTRVQSFHECGTIAGMRKMFRTKNSELVLWDSGSIFSTRWVSSPKLCSPSDFSTPLTDSELFSRYSLSFLLINYRHWQVLHVFQLSTYYLYTCYVLEQDEFSVREDFELKV